MPLVRAEAAAFASARANHDRTRGNRNLKNSARRPQKSVGAGVVGICGVGLLQHATPPERQGSCVAPGRRQSDERLHDARRGVNRRLRAVLKGLAIGAGAATAAYGGYVSVAWLRYGHPSRPLPEQEDELLDRFMPAYEVAERHHIRVNAPAGLTLAAACDTDLQGPAVVRAIIRAREILLGADPAGPRRPAGLLAEAQALGWGMLAEVPGREIVMGAVTRPWEANVTFRPLDPSAFPAFNERGHVKIVWTLRADPEGPGMSTFRTETRVLATDGDARRRFRRYWAYLSPGIILIRMAMLGPLKREAERRAHAAALR
jgi:hypothetical protein